MRSSGYFAPIYEDSMVVKFLKEKSEGLIAMLYCVYALSTRAILASLKLTRACYFQIALEIML